MDYQARSLQKFEATALVGRRNHVHVQAPNDVVALDAATGRIFLDLLVPSGTCRALVAGGSTADWPYSATHSSWERSTHIWSRSMPRTDGRLEHHDGESEVWLCHNACPPGAEG